MTHPAELPMKNPLPSLLPRHRSQRSLPPHFHPPTVTVLHFPSDQPRGFGTHVRYAFAQILPTL